MDEADKAKYKALYVKTASDYITELKEQLAKLTSGEESIDTITIVHRAAHSLGSQSQLMGYETTQAACRTIEKLFKAKKETNVDISPQTYLIVADLVKEIGLSVEFIDKTGQELDLTEKTKPLASVVS